MTLYSELYVVGRSIQLMHTAVFFYYSLVIIYRFGKGCARIRIGHFECFHKFVFLEFEF
jgi:hypothetical protein